jgi:transposase-like protein
MVHEPKTLQQAIQYFTDPQNCLDYLVARRWPDGVVCPTCGSENVAFVPSRRVWQCKTRHAKCQFSVKVGTIFEDSAIPLDKWLAAMWMIANCKNGVSSWEIHRALGVTQKSAWFMLQRIRLALQAAISGGGKLGGNGREVEVDETFIGGAARFMSRERYNRTVKNRRMYGKTIVAGLLERGGIVRATVTGSRRKKPLHEIIADNVEPGTDVYTDKFRSYDDLSQAGYKHQVIDHAERYVDGKVHTNGMENFWSCLKRGLKGTYISVEPFHLFRYLDEQVFRYNNRATTNNPMNDGDRFDLAVSHIVGKRLTYAEVTGKVGETTA